MREIKFRVWDGQKMVYLEPLTLQGVAEFQSALARTACPFSDLMQATGRVDVNGQIIYECDYVLRNERYLHKVSYSSAVGGFALQFHDRNDYLHEMRISRLDELRIIGNIFEQPDLEW